MSDKFEARHRKATDTSKAITGIIILMNHVYV